MASLDTVGARPPAAAGSSGPAIRARNLWKIFGSAAAKLATPPSADVTAADYRRETGSTIAVRDVSFDVAPGEVFVVMGLSGSGKSTLVRCLTRLIEPSFGEILFDGEDIRKADAARLRPSAASERLVRRLNQRRPAGSHRPSSFLR